LRLYRSAADCAAKSSLTLAMIKHHVQEQYTDAPDFSLFRLSAGLKKEVLISNSGLYGSK
jgi:hypothetical protein